MSLFQAIMQHIKSVIVLILYVDINSCNQIMLMSLIINSVLNYIYGKGVNEAEITKSNL